MRIGGYIPCSLIDFPGRLAAVVFTQGCNWRCPWCHNPALVYPDQFTQNIPASEILTKLTSRQGKLDGVVVSGGEPTIQPGLMDFLIGLRALGFATKLDTNGSQPGIVHTLLASGLLDFVAMDIKAPWTRYPQAAGVPIDNAAIGETIKLLQGSGVAHHFRTTRWPGLTAADETEILLLTQGSPHIWHEYRAVHEAKIAGIRKNYLKPVN